MADREGLVERKALEAAIEHHRAGRRAEAESLYRQVLAVDSGNFDALHLLGVVQLQSGKPQEAIDLITEALAGQPENYHALNHLGEAYRAMGFLDEAKTCFGRVLELKPDYVHAYNNLGNVYQADGQLDIAMFYFVKAIEVDPNYAEAHNNLGNALQERGQWDAAAASFQRALDVRPEFADASLSLGNLYKGLRRYDEAIPCLQRALELNPALTEARMALGRCFQEVGEREKAMQCFRKVASDQPENAEAQWALVMTEVALVHDDHGAVVNYREAFARGLHDLDRWFDAARIHSGFGALGTQQAFYLAYHEENNRNVLSQYGSLCRRLAEPWQDQHRLIPARPKRGKRRRVGLVSAHVFDHSVWHALVKGWCQNIDSQRVQLDIFALGTTVDKETEIAKSCASRFVQGLVRPLQWAEAILAEPLDALIYPEIGMDPMTGKLAALRLAPIQATTWGHPDTSGLPTMDFYFSAVDFEPPNAQDNYSEELVLLPNLGCCYQPLDTGVEDIALSDFDLDAGTPFFVCPGTPFKYAPEHDWIYPAIARQLGRCRFVFFKYPLQALSQQFLQRLATAFSVAGLPFEQYVMEIPWLSKPRFNGLMRNATGFLDTIGFSGFNTAIQAVECGLPVVTREGRFLRGRLASGILRRMGLRDLIAESEADYVQLAVRLASDRDFHRRTRDRIASARTTLYGDVAPVRSLEDFLAAASGV